MTLFFTVLIIYMVYAIYLFVYCIYGGHLLYVQLLDSLDFCYFQPVFITFSFQLMFLCLQVLPGLLSLFDFSQHFATFRKPVDVNASLSLLILLTFGQPFNTFSLQPTFCYVQLLAAQLLFYLQVLLSLLSLFDFSQWFAAFRKSFETWCFLLAFQCSQLLATVLLLLGYFYLKFLVSVL